MTTQKPRVAGYVPPDIYDRFKSFKEERGIKGDSQALAIMMAEFFGVPHQVAQVVDYSSFVTQEQFNEMGSKVAEVVAAIQKSNSPNGIISDLPNRLQRIEERLDEIERIKSSEATWGTGDLAKRLNMASSSLSHWKSDDPKRGKSPDELLKSTREKDPDGIGWILIPETGRFKPERPLPSKLSSDLPNESPNNLQGVLLSESPTIENLSGESPEEF